MKEPQVHIAPYVYWLGRTSPTLYRLAQSPYRPQACFDLVVCLEVLEHLEDPRPFAAKLLATGRIVIVSVPYQWPAGTWATHKQDPVDEAKLESWMGCVSVEILIIADGREHLVAVFRGSGGEHPSR